LAAAAFVLRLPFANRYDVFRDELYFIVCGRHPAFGYADQPPVVPLLAAGLYGLGHQTWLLRLPALLAAAALVWLTVRFARLLGGGPGAAWAAGILAGFAPMFLGLFATFNTTVFEPLAWTAIAYALARAALLGDRGAPVWAGIVVGGALEAKYALPTWLIALAIGLASTAQRRLLTRPELWIGLAFAVLIALPSIAWQAVNGWPFVELVRAAGDKNAAVAPLAFALNQLVVMNPLFAPIWIAGIVAPFAWRDLAPVRFVAIAFGVAAVLVVASHGKDYYLASAYPPLFALGAVALERVVSAAAARAAYLAAALAVSAVSAPVALPILAPAALPAYMARTHLSVAKSEKSFAGTALPQEFADELGWHDFVAQIAAAYASIPAPQRATTSIVLQNYGEAAALDVYGGTYGLPPALSGHNQYYLWGLRGQNPDAIMRPTKDPAQWRARCGRLAILGTTSSPFAMAYENGKSIVLCTHPHPPLARLWPELKNYS
jgi:4-amino-4-deoxy-L-arabinose transferase-like glycosyltransferase